MPDAMTEIANPAVCILFGGAISFVVSFLKRIPIVKRYPKVAASVLATLSAVLMPIVGANPVTWKIIAMCALEQFAASVATHEAVTHTVQNVAAKSDAG